MLPPPILYTEVQQSELLLRGLPWKATVTQIVLFLLSAGFQANEGGVQLCKDRRGRPNGRCVVRVKTTDDAIRAQTATHGKIWGTRYIEAYMRSQGVRTWCSAPPGDTQFGAFGQTTQIQA
jgi:hypothetical protein